MSSFFGKLLHIDRDLLEMAEVFRMPFGARMKYIYLPALFRRKTR